MTTIEHAKKRDVATVARLCCALWPSSTAAEMEHSVAADMDSGRAAFFLALDGENAVGFCHVSLRRDYVEGANSTPVGYLEGIYVEPSNRRQSVARQLIERSEQWAADRGCTELASDRALENTDSEAFHLAVGFREVNRTVSYIKSIEKPTNTPLLTENPNFWSTLDALVDSHEIIIDRPAGTAHPRYPDFIYPHDYGYLDGTSSMDGGGIDVWRGTLLSQRIDAIIVTVDMLKRDSEIKLLIGCNEREIGDIMEVHNSKSMRGLLIKRD